MSDTPLEVKAPWDAIDILPQERITGDILRGRGPRRGNLEHLIKFWRPIMRKPGGFRRCIIILANHPELYPLQPLCAWLHHETTGLWPNEGNHHEGGKLGPVLRAARRVVPGKRKRRRRKSDDGAVEMASWRLYRRHSRNIKGVSTQLIGGDQNAVEYKAARFVAGFKSVPVPASWEWDENYPKDVKVETVEDLLSTKVGFVTSHGRLGRSLQGLASFFIPGDMGKYRSPLRSALFGALTPGGGRGGGAGGGLPSIGGRALRCPTGYVNGGRFTDPKLSNCGGLVFDVPADGPGAVTAADRSKITRRFRGGDDLEDVARDIVVKKPKGDPFAVIREAAMKPKSTPNEKRRNSVVTDITSYASKNKNTTRIVRRDGVVFEPRVGPDELVKLKGHDNLKDSVYVTSKIPRTGSLANDEIRLLTKGVQSVDYVFPEGTLKVERKKEINSSVGAKMRTRWSALSRDPDVQINPLAAVERLAIEFPKEIKITSSFKGITNPNERVVVYSASGERRIVPRWVFSLYLSDKAPRRPKGRKPFSTVRLKNGEKVISHKRPERDNYSALLIEYKSLGLNADARMPVRKKNVSDLRISHTYGLNKDSLIDIKVARLMMASDSQEMAVKRLGRRSLAGRSISHMARRMPKVVPYDRNARDGDNDGIVQEGTIWERPSGAVFRGIANGARKLIGSSDLVDADGNRIDYKPGDHERSPLRSRDTAKRINRRARRFIRDRDEREGAEADFGPIERRRELRRARIQRATRRLERSPERRERRADRLDAQAERNEERGRADEELAEQMRQFRIERNEMEARHREEMAELEERNPRSRGRNRERRQERRQERAGAVEDRARRFIRDRDEREGAEADFDKPNRERAERRRERARRIEDRARGFIRGRDEREGADADFRKLDRERAERRERRRERAGRIEDRARGFIERRDEREGAEADFGEINERARQRRERMSAIGQRWRELIGSKRRSESDREMENKIIGDVPDGDREDALVSVEAGILNDDGIGTPDSNEKEMKAIAKAQAVETFLDDEAFVMTEAELRELNQEEAEEGLNWIIEEITGGKSPKEITITPELLDVFDEEISQLADLLDSPIEDLDDISNWAPRGDLEGNEGKTLGQIFAEILVDADERGVGTQGRMAKFSIMRMADNVRKFSDFGEERETGEFKVQDIVDNLMDDPDDAEVIEFSMFRLRQRLATLEKARDIKKQKLNHALKESGGIAYLQRDSEGDVIAGEGGEPIWENRNFFQSGAPMDNPRWWQEKFPHFIQMEMAHDDLERIEEEIAAAKTAIIDLDRHAGDVVDLVDGDVSDPIKAIRNQDIDEFEAELVSHMLDRRFDIVEAEYAQMYDDDKDLAGHVSGVPNFTPEDHGLDMDALFQEAQNGNLDTTEAALDSWIQSALRLGKDNSFMGKDGKWEFKIVNPSGETPELRKSITPGGKLTIELPSTQGKIHYRKKNRDGSWTDWKSDNNGYTARYIYFIPEDGKFKIEVKNSLMYPSGSNDGTKLKNSGFATFFNYNAFLHYKGAGATHVNVTTGDDGPVFWAMQGFESDHVTTEVLNRLKSAIDRGLDTDGNMKDKNTPIQNLEQRERILKLLEMKESGRNVTTLMIHSALKWEGKHDWEGQSKERNADGTYKRRGARTGIANSRYGQWFKDYGHMSQGQFRLDDDSALGRYLDGVLQKIRNNANNADDNIADPWGGRAAYIVKNNRVVRGPVRRSAVNLRTDERLYPVSDPIVLESLERQGIRPNAALGVNDLDALIAGAM